MPETVKEELVLEKIRKQASQAFLTWFQKYLRKPSLSLRLIEHYVSAYSKRNNTSYTRPMPGSKEPRMFHVHSSYKAQIRAYSRTYFDAFCRRNAKPVALPSLELRKARTGELQTCAAQLNYFYWLYKNGILEQAVKIKEELTKDSQTTRSTSTRKSSTSKPVAKTVKKSSVVISVPDGTSSLHLTFK